MSTKVRDLNGQLHKPYLRFVKGHPQPLPDEWRHLYWIINSPGMMSDYEYGETKTASLDDRWLRKKWSEFMDDIVDLDAMILRLETFTNPYRSAYLGHYFESLFEFWLRQCPSTEIIAHNRQVTDKDGKTAGEVDFICKDLDNGEYLHIETAVKFYLSSSNNGRWVSWVGPNANDTLHNKLSKVADRQIPLVRDTDEIQKLADGHPIRSHLMMKGIFFTKHGPQDEVMPDFSSPNAITGKWCYQRDIDQPIDRNLYWKIIDKHDWLAPAIYGPGQRGILTSGEIIKKLRPKMDSAKMLVGLEKVSGLYLETERLVVVNDDWPAKQP